MRIRIDGVGMGLAALLLGTSGCATLTTVAGGCGQGSISGVCLGPMEIPAEQSAAFLEASSQAIDAIHSPGFESGLRVFAEGPSKTGPHSDAWRSFELATVLTELRSKIEGMQVETYGSVGGLFGSVFFGNVAYDGATDGPIRLNRWALPRPSASLANTIAHEVAHRAGLRHPSSSRDLDTARCEPPYVIGSLVQKELEGASWKLSGDDCPLLTSAAP